MNKLHRCENMYNHERNLQKYLLKGTEKDETILLALKESLTFPPSFIGFDADCLFAGR